MSEPSKWSRPRFLGGGERTITEAEVIPMQTRTRFDFTAAANEIIEAMNACVVTQGEVARCARAWHEQHERLNKQQAEVRLLQKQWVDQAKALDIPPPGSWPMAGPVGPPSYAVMPQEPPTISMEVESHG